MVKKNLTFHPLTPERWKDFEELFGENGACGGCWCMWWKLTRSQFNLQKGTKNKEAQQSIVNNDTIPGLLAFSDGIPVGWCALEPRNHYPVLDRSRILKKVDETPVWSVTCFFIRKKYRRQGLNTALIKAAIEYVSLCGGNVIEGYPTEPKKEKSPDAFVWTGLMSAFLKSGFIECARRSETRPIMRYYISR